MTNEVRTALAFLPVVFAIGTLGYWSIEGWSPMDAFFMTLITISTVALRDTPIRKEMDVIVGGARDTLIVLGRRDNLRRLARMAAGESRDGT